MKGRKKEIKRLKRNNEILASIIAILISPVFINQTSTIIGKKFKYTYG